METPGPTLTLEIVTFAIHEDVVHEHHAEHAGINMEVAEDKREVRWLQNRERCAFVASQDSPLPTPIGDLCTPKSTPYIPWAGNGTGWGRRHLNPLPFALSRWERTWRTVVVPLACGVV